MVTTVSIAVRFSNGTIAYLQNDAVANGLAGEQILTDNQGGDLAQTAGISVGQAYTGLTATHACVLVQEIGAATGRLIWANFRGPDGAVICPIQGSGWATGRMLPLYRPVLMTTGVVVFAAAQVASDSATLIGSVDVCSPNKCDQFGVVAVDGTNTELKNKDGATIGQSFNGIVAHQMTASYASNIGMNEAGGGVSFLFVTASDGTMKAMIPAQQSSQGFEGPSINYPVQLLQNDGLFINTDT
tara:strand:- start:651 stop:1379 length:729 start_codon:yes stop_codon:yes gene_type:complete